MAYNHGVKISEVPTSIQPSASVASGIPFIVGTAPVNMTDTANVNKPVLCYSYAEAVAAFGYVAPKEDSASGLKKFEYTISEFINSQFTLFGVGPVMIVNVLDPVTHKSTATTTTVTLDAKQGSATIAETGILADSIVLGDYSKGTDYVVAFNDDGNAVITSLKGTDGAFKCTVGSELSFSAEKLDPSKVTAEDVVGGVDTAGNKSGLELISDCFPRFRMNPDIILAPGFSESATVAAVMASKAASINKIAKAVALIDVPTDTVKQYTAVANWKNDNNIVDPLQVICWPLLALDGVVYHQSTQLASLMGEVDGGNDGVPYESPSNKNYVMTATVLADGKEVWINNENAEYLNGQGVVTALNSINGWTCWGNRTACYPTNLDVKDNFIAIRRMINWVGNTLVQSYWSKLDNPLNRRQIDAIVDSANIWLNGLTARQYILGGKVEFLDSENPTTDLMDGISRFHVSVTPPSPNREIDFIIEYNPDYVSTLFS